MTMARIKAFIKNKLKSDEEMEPSVDNTKNEGTIIIETANDATENAA